MTLEEIQTQIARLKQQDYINSMSNDFAYTDGSHQAIMQAIADLEKQIEKTS